MSTNVSGKNKGISRLKKYFLSRKGKKDMFFVLMMILPIIQFSFFYIAVNFNSLIMAFQKYENNPNGVGYLISFAGMSNFSVAWRTFVENGDMLLRTTISFVMHVGVGITLALFFSYFIYKNYVGSKFFKVILFMPQIISAVVFSLLFKYMVTDGYMAITKLITGVEAEGLLSISNPTRRFFTVLIYTVWTGFGVNVLLFSGSMSGINESVVESAHLDGANTLQEFFHITIPMIFPTLISFIVLAIAGFFTNQMGLYTFFEAEAQDISVMGYYLYVTAMKSDLVGGIRLAYLNYSQLAALGLILTFIIIPVTMIIRKMLVKFGPSSD